MPVVKIADAYAAVRKRQTDHPQPKSPALLAWEARWHREHGAEYDRLFGSVNPNRGESDGD